MGKIDDAPVSANTQPVPVQSAVADALDTRKQVFTETLAVERLHLDAQKQQQLRDFTLEDEHWFKAHWRPTMGWLYAAICACDFIIFPIGSWLTAALHIVAYTPWVPITLQGGGLIHLAFGAILGITSWSRGQEKRAIIDGITKNGDDH